MQYWVLLDQTRGLGQHNSVNVVFRGGPVGHHSPAFTVHRQFSPQETQKKKLKPKTDFRLLPSTEFKFKLCGNLAVAARSSKFDMWRKFSLEVGLGIVSMLLYSTVLSIGDED